MGSKISHHSTDCSSNCKCFINDKRVQNIDIVRYSSHKWKWSEFHQLALIECFDDQECNFPLNLISVIKSHLFSNASHIICRNAIISIEKYYPMVNKLLDKKLCYQWYISQFLNFTSLSIAIISEPINNSSETFLNALEQTSLPAMQPRGNNVDDCQIKRRTIHVDDCQITVKLIKSIDNYPKYCEIYFIILGENDTINDADKIMKKLQNIHKCEPKCYILIRMTKNGIANYKSVFENDQLTKLANNENDQLIHNYNVSSITTSLDSEKSINDLFSFAIKYYWFHIVK
eukprot:516537_1